MLITWKIGVNSLVPETAQEANYYLYLFFSVTIEIITWEKWKTS